MFLLKFITYMLCFGVMVVVISTVIPVLGFFRKRWKGLAIGLLLLPVVCAVVIGAVGLGVYYYHEYSINMEKKSAMVTVRSIEKSSNDTDTLTWYLKADEECIQLDSEDYEEYFDVIRLDSLSAGVSVEDRIVVRFDLKNQKVSATDFDKPAEVVDVNWDKVKAYFN